MIIPFIVKQQAPASKLNIEDTFKQVIEVIRDQKMALFCGAGISFASGLPIVSSLLNYVFSKLELTAKQIELIHDSNLPFESIMEMILRESGLDKIQEIFSQGNPNCNHIFIAKLAKKKFIRLIYTTNFDTLIEDALEAEEMKAGRDFKVFYTEEDFNSIAWDESCVSVIKIHGCVSKKKDMAITMSLIASDRYSAIRETLLRKIFCADYCDHVLILGYSCSDLDLTPIIQSFNGKKSHIFFIEHQDSQFDCKSEPISLRNERNPFQNYTGERLLVNTDELVERLWRTILSEDYQHSMKQRTNWKTNIDAWYFEGIEESGVGIKHHISARLLYAVGQFEEAINHNSKAVSIALKTNNLVAYSSEVGNMGMALNAIGDYKQAEFCFKESIPLCRRLGKLENVSSQLQAYGNVLHHMGKDVEALENHHEALRYAELEKDEYSISTILGNMSNSYNRLGEYDKALTSLNKALCISKKLGNKQGESSQLGILANTHLLREDYFQGLKYCIQGLEIKKQIGDRQGECMMMANLVGIYRLTGKTHQALEIAKDCLALAKSIGNVQVQQMLELNLILLNDIS